VDASPAFAADVCQKLRIRLLVRDGDIPPRIVRYTGEVPLSAWIRVIALRLALNAKRGPLMAARDDESEAEGTSLDDPELEYLRSQYKAPFVRALQEAIGGLPKDDRTILRLHYVDGVNIDGIGRVFQVHRATVARWLVRIRAEVLARAKQRLAEQVGAEPDEASSVIGALAGEIDVSISRVLGKAVEGGPKEGP
jgi:RNA polymerase sigma-70 factor (ECF subfamily)